MNTYKTLTEHALDRLFSIYCPIQFLEFLKENYFVKFASLFDDSYVDPIELIEIADETIGIRYEIMDFMRFNNQTE